MVMTQAFSASAALDRTRQRPASNSPQRQPDLLAEAPSQPGQVLFVVALGLNELILSLWREDHPH